MHELTCELMAISYISLLNGHCHRYLLDDVLAGMSWPPGVLCQCFAD